MKPFNKRTIVEREKRLNDKIKVGDKEFILDPIFREYWNTVHMAKVVESDRDDLEAGDLVYVHHFVNAPEQTLPMKGNLSFVEFNQIYCRIRNNELMVLDNYVLIKPVTYASTGMIKESKGLLLTSKSANERLEKVGEVAMLSGNCIDAGLNIGDKVLFNKNCEYEILIEGEIYYRMELRDVITTLDSWEQIAV